MAQTAFSVRMEDGLKREFSAFCENVGMNMSTAIVVYGEPVDIILVEKDIVGDSC